jgi:hypothetical protein
LNNFKLEFTDQRKVKNEEVTPAIAPKAVMLKYRGDFLAGLPLLNSSIAFAQNKEYTWNINDEKQTPLMRKDLGGMLVSPINDFNAMR